MRIYSYNVNGIRAAIKNGLLKWMKEANPDVLCLQEIKADASVFPKDKFEKLGYHVFIHPAVKKGYSGVAVLSKTKPNNTVIGMGVETYDNEGRVLQVDFNDLSVISMYLPSGTNTDRLGFKFNFMDTFYLYIQELLRNNKNIVICGDYNICHQAIDIHDPVSNKNTSGFLPEEREWLTKFLGLGLVDSFRYFCEEPHQYSWWSYRARARENNKGWRLDYCLTSDELTTKLINANIDTQAVHSDHCPVYVQISN